MFISEESGIDLFFENYDLVPASSWGNYFAIDDINAIDYYYEER
jgi:hypothetical protein